MHTVHRTTNIFDRQHVTKHDLRAQFLQRLRAVVFAANKSDDLVAVFQQVANGGSVRSARGTRDEKFLHINLPALSNLGPTFIAAIATHIVSPSYYQSIRPPYPPTQHHFQT